MLFLDPGDGRVPGLLSSRTIGGKASLHLLRQIGIRPGHHNPEDLNSVSTPAKLVETANATAATSAASSSITTSSALRGMLVAEECRGKGYARVFLGIWLDLQQAESFQLPHASTSPCCADACATRLHAPAWRHRERKPGKKRNPKQRPLAVEVSVGRRTACYSVPRRRRS